MADGEPDSDELARRLAELTQRISELETRISELESRPADPSARTQDAGQPPAQPYPWQGGWQAQGPWQQPWPPAPPQQPWWQHPVGQPTAPPVPPQQPAPAPQRPVAPPYPVAPQPQPPAPWPVPATPAAPVRAAAAAPARQPAAYAPSQSTADELRVSLASLRDLESRLTGRLLAWVGSAAVVLGSVFFLSLAFSRGWIGPEGRVALGLAGGAAFVAAGAWLFGRRQASLGHVLVAVGLGVVSLSLFAGTRYYSLYPPETALAGSFVAAVVAAAVAIRVKSETVAIFGLLAIAAAPPIMGAGANAVTIAFLAVTVVGTTVVSLARSWRWLPPTAFLITAPQLVFWLSVKPDAPTAVVALAAYWLLHAVAASADELRSRHGEDDAEVRAEALFLINSILAIGGGLWVLSGNLAAWQGAYVAAASVAHFAFGAYFVWRRGDKYPFGLLINAIGVTAVALAVERQFDGPAVAVGWAIEGAVLAAIFGFRKNDYAGGAAAILGTLAVAHLGEYEFPWLHWTLQGTTGSGTFPFADQAGLALAGLLLSGLAAGWLCRRADVRVALLIAGSLLVAYALPFEVSGTALVAAWAAEGVALAAVWGFRRDDYLGLTAMLLGTGALVHFCSYEYALADWTLNGATRAGAFPFANSAGLALACLLAAGFAAAILARSREVRTGLLVAGSLVVAYALPFELSGTALVAAWSAEVVALVAICGFRPNAYVGVAAAVAGALAVAHLGAYEFPWLQWTLRGVAGPGPFAFADAAGLALACVLLAAVLSGLLSRNHSARCGLTAGGLLLVAYSLPFELSGVALVAGWSALLPVAMAAEGLLDMLPGVPASRATLRKVPMLLMNQVHWPDSPLLAAMASAVLAVAHMGAYEMPISSTSAIVIPAVPFADLAAASAAIGIASFLAASRITARPDLRVGGIVVAAALAAYTSYFELALPFAVVAWCALAIAIGSLPFWMKYAWQTYPLAGSIFVAASIFAVMGQIDPVERLGVRAGVALTGTWFAIDAVLAIGATALAVAAAAAYLPLPKATRATLATAVGVALVYLASTLLVDFFQRQVGGHVALEELQKQAQVSVSILWGLIGMGVFLAGLIGWRQGVREAGLGLLALATGKVFLFDLSYLDVAYRVLSLIGLGLLLLVGAFAYQSLKPRRPTQAGEAPEKPTGEVPAP